MSNHWKTPSIALIALDEDVPRPYLRFGLGLLLILILFFGAAIWPPEGTAVGSHDMRGLFYPWLEQLRNALWRGHLPWWDADLMAGYPFLANPQIALFYPLTWLAILPPLRLGISFYLLAHLWLAGMGMFRLVRAWVAPSAPRFWPAALAALTFALSSFFAARLYAGHFGLIAMHSWVPWLLWATLWAARSHHNWLPRTTLAAVPLALAILAGHTTSLLYVGLAWGAFGLWLVLAEQAGWRLIGQMGLMALLALLLSAVQLLPFAQLAFVAGRTAEADFAFATGFSFPPAHLITLLVPQFFGEPIRAGYWSVPNFEELAAYAGLLPLVALLLTLLRPSRRALFLLGLMLFGFLLALGNYGFLYAIFYDWLPPFRLARAPGRAMFLYVLAASLLVGVWLGRWPQSRPTATQLRWLMGGTAVALLATLAAIGSQFAAIHPTAESGRLWHQLGGWSMALGGLFCFWVVLGWGGWGQAARPWLGWSLAGLLLIDLFFFGAPFIYTQHITPDSFWFGARDLIADQETPAPGRVLPWGINIFAQNGAAQVGLASVYGYNALELGATSRLAASVPDPRATSFDILGARYVIAQSELAQFTEGEAGLHSIGVRGAWVYKRPRALPLARLVYQAEVIGDTAVALARLHQPDFDPVQTAILAEEAACVGQMGAGTADILDRGDGFWHLRTVSDTPALLVLSEAAYPGWSVMVDGQEAKWVTAYTAVRAVCVPAGEHLVTWHYRPTIFAWGGLLSAVGLFFVILAWRKRP